MRFAPGLADQGVNRIITSSLFITWWFTADQSLTLGSLWPNRTLSTYEQPWPPGRMLKSKYHKQDVIEVSVSHTQKNLTQMPHRSYPLIAYPEHETHKVWAEKEESWPRTHTMILWLVHSSLCPSLTLWSFEISSWNFKNWSKWICQIPRVCSFINSIIFSYPLTKSTFLIFMVPLAHNRYFN